MIQYSQKVNALRELKKYWREDVDYQISYATAEKVPHRQPTKYKLTTTCFEHLIALKVDWVFEIYRRTFHAVLFGQIKPSMDLDNSIETAKAVMKYAQSYIEQAEALEQSGGEKGEAL